MPVKGIEEVLAEQSDRLLTLPGVVGTALGLADGEPCITVYVVTRGEELARLLPAELDGYPVVLAETGKVSAR